MIDHVIFAAKCENLITPRGGDVTLTTSGTQTTAIYTCGVGYTIDGQPNPECATNGSWTASEPTCGNSKLNIFNDIRNETVFILITNITLSLTDELLIPFIFFHIPRRTVALHYDLWKQSHNCDFNIFHVILHMVYVEKYHSLRQNKTRLLKLKQCHIVIVIFRL